VGIRYGHDKEKDQKDLKPTVRGLTITKKVADKLYIKVKFGQYVAV